MRKINKAQARKIYNNGGKIIIVPYRVNPTGTLSSGWIDKNCMAEFNQLCNSISYYQCNSECGKWLAYYTE